jgi:hypothetical protein
VRFYNQYCNSSSNRTILSLENADFYRVKKIFAVRHSKSRVQKRKEKTIFALVGEKDFIPFVPQFFVVHTHSKKNRFCTELLRFGIFLRNDFKFRGIKIVS